MKLKWQARARADLYNIRNYIRKYNPQAAERIAFDINRAAYRLKSFPQLGRHSDILNVRLMQVPRLPYLLPYRVSADLVEILAVVDERRERPPEWS